MTPVEQRNVSEEDEKLSILPNTEAGNEQDARGSVQQGDETEVNGGRLPPKRRRTAADLERYNFRVAVNSWDEIGSLATEVTSSVLSQIALNMSEQMSEENLAQQQRRKKQKTIPSSCAESPTVPANVSSDEELSSLPGHSLHIPRSLTQKIDRMARMSKYMMQMERYHRFIRDEMVAITEEGDQDP